MPAPGPPPRLGAFQMVDAMDGWATVRGTGSDLYIRHTTDGGVAWQSANPPNAPVAYIVNTFFLGRSDVWLTERVRAEVATVFHSADSGRTWECSAPIQFGGSLDRSHLTFSDPLHGWFLADYGVKDNAQAVAIFNTEDGGMHWVGRSLTASDPAQSTGDSLPYPCIKQGITFHDPLTGWATGDCPDGEFFFVTHTGGWSWQRLSLDTLDRSVPPLQGGLHIRPPVFSSAMNGVFLAEGGSGARMYLTDDGGVTWRARALPLSPYDSNLDFINATDGWFIANNHLYATHDGGRTWTAIIPTFDSTAIPGFTPRLDDVVLSFVDEKVGFAGDYGTFPSFWKTNDGGTIWVQMRL
ncbi:MAG: WD40/YVTN/BNR-like repeat-containing protein [Thermomicrobiales bacterium]